MKLKELLIEIQKIKDSLPGYYDDATVMLFNAQGYYCEVSGVDTDAKDRICIIEKIYEKG